MKAWNRSLTYDDILLTYLLTGVDTYYDYDYYLPPKGQMTKYNVVNAAGQVLFSFDTEQQAISDAESRAQANKGREFFVHKSTAITKSYVAPSPFITTRL